MRTKTPRLNRSSELPPDSSAGEELADAVLRNGNDKSLFQDGGSAQKNREASLDAAYEDYCQRLEQGESIDAERLCARYPGLESALRRQIEVHEVLDDNISLLLNCCEQLWPHPSDHIAGFELVEEIGRGAFARVYLAKDTNLGARTVALKVCHSGAHEAWILGKLEHENIVPVLSVHDLGFGLSGICMPYLGRSTLRDIMSSKGDAKEARHRVLSVTAGSGQDGHTQSMRNGVARWPRCGAHINRALLIGSRIADALAHAHGQGIFHLDLKPANVLMHERGHPRLLDFNLASERSKGVPRLGGTLPYMAPEQARCFLNGEDGSVLDARTDIYSLGVILYEMLCGVLPYERAPQTLSSPSVVADLLERQQHVGATLWTECRVDRRVRDIVDRCLAVDPNDRYQSAEQLASDLRRQLTFFRRAKRWIQAHRRMTVGTAVAAVLLGSVVFAAFASRDPYFVRRHRAGMNYLEAGEYGRAIKQLTLSLEAAPNQPETLFARAEASVATGVFHEAIRDLLAANETRDDAKQCALLAYCHNNVETHEVAIDFYEKAIRGGFATVGVLNNLGYSYHLRGRHRKAAETLDAAVELGERPAITLYNRAVVWRALAISGGYEPVQAMRDINAAMSAGNCTGDAYYCAATIYGYAASLGNSWEPQIWEFIRLALEHGTPATSIATDPFLSPFFQEASVHSSLPQGARDQSVWLSSHFIHPFE